MKCSSCSKYASLLRVNVPNIYLDVKLNPREKFKIWPSAKLNPREKSEILRLRK